MDDALGVRRPQRVGDLDGEVEQDGRFERFFVDPFLE